MKKILGLDLGTNSIGWALVDVDDNGNIVKIIKLGSRIIPMDERAISDFNTGALKTQTAERTRLRGVRRLAERHLLRRERLHRVLNILRFLPEHYFNTIDFEKRLGKFKENIEPNLVYRYNESTGNFDFIFKSSFEEMISEFKNTQPALFYNKSNGEETKIPYDWTIYYLRKKALTQKIEKEELAWLLLNFNQKRGYYQLRGEDENEGNKTIKEEVLALKINEIIEGEIDKKNDKRKWYSVILENGWTYRSTFYSKPNWIGLTKEFIVITELDEDNNIKKDRDGIEKRRLSILPSFEEIELLSQSDKNKIYKKIKLKTEIEIEKSNKTVGCYIYDTLIQNPTQKINGKLVRTIERKFYKQELESILKCQQVLHPELKNTNLYKVCLEELYENNENHKNNIGNKDFVHLFLNDIIFYQRPLKSKKSLISDCPYETRTFFKDGIKETQGIKCITKSNPLFQEFRLWQFLQNLRIYEKEKLVNGKLQTDVDVTHEFLKTDEDWVTLFDWLNERKSIKHEMLLKYQPFNLKKNIDNYRWNYVEDKEYPCNETHAAIATKLKNCLNIPADFLSKDIESTLWHILYSVEDKFETEKALTKFAAKNNLGNDFVKEFMKFPPFKKEYGSYSEKAIKKLLPLMRRGKYWEETSIHQQTTHRINKIITSEYDEKIRNRVRDKAINITNINDCNNLPLWLACYIVYDRHSETGEIKHWKNPSDIETYLRNEFKQHSLRNPVVEQVITETLRVVTDIWKCFGNNQPEFFKEIHIELGREMKNPADKRKQLTNKISENENTNQRIKALLIEMLNDSDFEDVRPYSPSQQEILKIYENGVLSQYTEIELKNEKIDDIEISKVAKAGNPTKKELEKYKLWLSQKYKSPYTGKPIPLSKLFTPAYQIEHIIPQAKYFDDSFTNKVICEAEVNALKDNRTAYQFIKICHGQIVELNFGEKVKVFELEEYEKNVKEMYANNRGKMKRLLMEDVSDEFINRQLNDSRYISKVVKSLLSNIVREDGEEEATSKYVLSTNGSITNTLKQDWGLNDVWNTIVTPRFERLNALTNTNNFGSWTNKDGKLVFQTEVPFDLQKGFTKKRIDHRHHALDALIIACATRNHINFLNNESAKANKKDTRHELRNILCYKKFNGDNNNNYKWVFKKPWETFTQDSLEQLQTTVVCFKQNLRVINKTVNYYQHWTTNENGIKEKVIEKQTKGESWAIRKPMHKDTVSGVVHVRYKKMVSFLNGIKEWQKLVDKNLKRVIKKQVENGADEKAIAKYFKANPYTIDGNQVVNVELYDYTANATASRISLSDKFTPKQLEGITDSGIKKILENHLLNYLDEKGNKQFELAFNADGVEKLNTNIKALNGGKNHKPIYKVRLYEEGSKFNVGLKGNRKDKFVEAAKGTNLFFAIYWNEVTKKREFETIPLNEVIEHQKLVASLPKDERTPVPINKEKGQFLFSLSPDDLVYVPNAEEQEHPNIVDFKKLTQEQTQKVYKMVSTTQDKLECVPYYYASPIIKNEMGSNNKNQNTMDSLYQIKSICWKLKVDRLGNIIQIFK